MTFLSSSFLTDLHRPLPEFLRLFIPEQKHQVLALKCVSLIES